jgi:hypothetical protein
LEAERGGHGARHTGEQVPQAADRATEQEQHRHRGAGSASAEDEVPDKQPDPDRRGVVLEGVSDEGEQRDVIDTVADHHRDEAQGNGPDQWGGRHETQFGDHVGHDPVAMTIPGGGR